jgi:hypothetical protein
MRAAEILHTSPHSFSVNPGTGSLARVMRGGGADFQAMTVPDGAFAAVVGHLEILGQFEAIGGAGVFAEAAEHAAGGVVGEGGEDFSAGGVVAQPANYDQIFRARERAKIAGNAERFAGFGVDIQARGAAITFGDHGALLRILFRVYVLGRLVAKSEPHAFEEVYQKDTAKKFVHLLDCDWAVCGCQ